MLLNNDSIHAAVEDVRSFLKNKNIDEAEALRVCLSVEEVLLEYKDQLGENVEFRLLHKKDLVHITLLSLSVANLMTRSKA